MANPSLTYRPTTTPISTSQTSQMVSWKSKMYFSTFPSQYELKYDLDFHRVRDLTKSRAVCPDCCNSANAVVATASPAQKQAQTIPSYFYVAKPKAKVSHEQLFRGLNFSPYICFTGATENTCIYFIFFVFAGQKPISKCCRLTDSPQNDHVHFCSYNTFHPKEKNNFLCILNLNL